jgi:hypothetical protein
MTLKKKNRLECPHPQNRRYQGMCLDCNYEVNPPMPVRRVSERTVTNIDVEITLLKEDSNYFLFGIHPNQHTFFCSSEMLFVLQYLENISIKETQPYYQFKIADKPAWERELKNQFQSISFKVLYIIRNGDKFLFEY